MSRVDEVIEGVERVRKGLCCYAGSTCDCKYGFNGSQRGSTEATGCPELRDVLDYLREPIPMRLPCPRCGALHVDEGEFATKEHHTHACQECGNVWRPALIATVGVRFLPGFKNDE